MKNSWNEVSITDWKAIKAIVESDLEPLEKNVNTIAVLKGVSPKEIWNMPMGELKMITSSLDWMDDFSFNKRANFSKIKIEGQTYDITTDLNKLSVAAYADFQFYMEKREENMGLILTCFIVPQGKDYGDGYDVKELAQVFEDKLSIVFWNEVFFSLIKNSLYLIRASEIYLDWTARKDPEIQETLRKKMKDLKDMYGLPS